MKQLFPLPFRTLLALAAAQLGLFLCPALEAGVSFTATPAVVSNTYSGFITLQAKGLTNGETVLVQKFLDLNGNGVIDAGDWLVQQFPLTDGEAGMVIGGIVNSNVPGDTDAVAGQITAQVNFQNGDFMQNAGANYLYALSSPSGRFAPITNLFVVTNVPYAQKITGQVLLAGAGTPVPHAAVLLFGPPKPGKGGPSGSPMAGTAADATGSYTLPVPPGTYMPVAFPSNCLADFAAPVVVTLTNTQVVATNLLATGATNSISGTLVDANNPALALPGVLVSASSDSGLFAVTLTRSNGGFNLGVEAGQWTVKPDDTSLIVQGYLGAKDGSNVNAGAAGVAVGAPKATALFYGRATDTQGSPLVNLDIYANDNNNNVYEADGYTDVNGYYCAGAVGGLGSGDPWSVEVSSDTAPANYAFSQPAFEQNGGTNLAAGQAVLANFTALLATNEISGYLKDNNSNALSGVGIWASATIGGVNFNASANTDSNGYYSFAVGNGTWSVGVNTGSGGDALSSSYLSPAPQNIVIADNNAALNLTALTATYVISGNVQVAGGIPVSGVGVWALATINGLKYNPEVDTDGSGHYSLNLGTGEWAVGVNCSGGTDCLDAILGAGKYQCPNSQNLTITNAGGTADFTVQPPGFQITNAFLPNGTVGVYYSAQLGASAGQPPYGFRLATGSGPLPGGLGLSTAGLISGTPTNSGIWSFNIEATDASANTAYQLLSITIHPKPILESPRRQGNGVGLWLIGAMNQNYTLQMSTNLSSTNWTSLLVTNNATTNNFVVIDPAATNRYRFYRILVGP